MVQMVIPTLTSVVLAVVRVNPLLVMGMAARVATPSGEEGVVVVVLTAQARVATVVIP